MIYKNHLNYFKIENFKRFNSLELSDIGQFNLIVGDNNVGKTSVLEALLFAKDRYPINAPNHLLQNLYEAANRRERKTISIENTDILKEYYQNNKKNIFLTIQTFVDTIERNFEFYSKSESELADSTNTTAYQNSINSFNEIKRFKYNLLIHENINNGSVDPKIINNNHIYNEKVLQPFFPMVSTEFDRNDINTDGDNYRNKDLLLKGVKLFDNSYDDFHIVLDGLNKLDNIYFKRRNENELSHSIFRFGDGALRMFRILCKLQEAAKYTHYVNFLAIDEIDTGIHYTKLKNYWKIILETANKLEIQIFCTTHSLEAINFYSDALAELGEDYQEKARLFRLNEMNDGNVRPSVFNFERLKTYLDSENEVRGGKFEFT